MRKIIVFAYAVGILIIGTVQSADAEMYKYTDKHGIIGFADNLQSVPEQYRAGAVLVTEESGEEQTRTAPMPVQTPASEPVPVQAVAVGSKPARPFSFRLMISGIICFFAVLLFVAVKQIPRLRNDEKSVSYVKNALIGVVSLYLVIAHVKDFMTLFGMAGSAVEEAQQRSAEKGKKAAQAMKQLDAMIQEAAQKEQEFAKDETENKGGK